MLSPITRKLTAIRAFWTTIETDVRYRTVHGNKIKNIIAITYILIARYLINTGRKA